jgi:hypothetical protein
MSLKAASAISVRLPGFVRRSVSFESGLLSPGLESSGPSLLDRVLSKLASAGDVEILFVILSCSTCFSDQAVRFLVDTTRPPSSRSESAPDPQETGVAY